ncbi:MAG: primosomal protein N' [Prevotella sp.]|nr:primosomal protein N' [Bacteroides sp.]MCM1366579.1 primosomal protein N' [Prevotella sp.]MCM1437248.1 primosomal protein N' [Prevotella sp.]
MGFVEVILPLPLPGTFTYSLPPDLTQKVEVGMRVYVQFGKRKYYTGIIDEIHDREPRNYEVKPIMALLDNRPTVRYPQRKIWNWIADYYLCTVGDVFKAAVPSGLKIESETYVSLNKDYEPVAECKLSEADAEIITVLEHSGRQRLEQLSKILQIKGLGAKVCRLMEKGILRIDENAVERYKPKKEVCLKLNAQRGDNDKIHEFFDLVTRSARQQKALVAYLDKSRWLVPNSELTEVTKKEICELEGINPGIVKALVVKGIFEEYCRVQNRFDRMSGNGKVNLHPLSDAQSVALSQVHQSMLSYGVTLLHGVTGSGKTEIYSHLMQEALQNGKQVLYLVPEISLTTQLTDRLRRIFGEKLLVYHSKFSDSERVDIWNRVLESSEPMIVLGVRSSVFLPFYHLGLVIVDEEHEASYKQYDPAPRYNARDAAIVLASMHGAKTLLGSATPSIETYFKAKNGKYGFVQITERFGNAALPQVEIVDMKNQRKRKVNKGILSEPLRITTLKALKEGKQGIMFQNRRGFAPYVICKECGWTPKCVNCDVSLVFHKHNNELKCHYCGYTVIPSNICPACGLNGIEIYGYGTERIADELHKEFEGYRVSRMDLDTTRNKDSYQEIIEEFSRQETDILVGTQMVTKGLDFGKVSVVGVLNADTILNFPDFRSGERAFNMLEQVSGRAGRRSEIPGKVIIQTSDPESQILRYVKAHDYATYYKEQLADRKKFMYPPFTKIINIYLKNKDERIVDSLAVDYTMALKNIFGERVLGPEKPYVGRISTWYLQGIMLKVEAGASMLKVKDILRKLYVSFARDTRMKTSQLYYDVDPV